MTLRGKTQLVAISLQTGGQGFQGGGVRYAPDRPAPDQPLPDVMVQPVDWARAARDLLRIKRCVANLILDAREGRPRRNNEFQEAVADLAAKLCPSGAYSMVAWDQDPQLEIYQPQLAEVPWEAFLEPLRTCVNSSCDQAGVPAEPTRAVCDCGSALETVERPAAIRRKLSFIERSSAPSPPPEGREFLIVADPLGDLCANTDAICKNHVLQIRELLESAGLTVRILSGAGATYDQVMRNIRSEKMIGMYYFGHGELPPDSNQNCLVLADETPLYAVDIKEANPRMRFVFLNACHAAAAGADWGVERPFLGIANAFARGGVQKTVIAPIWKIINTHAAAAGLMFFQHLCNQLSIGEALRIVREHSYQSFQQGEPDLLWAAYRQLGDAGQTLVKPPVETPSSASGDETSASRVFAGGGFQPEYFAFDVSPVIAGAVRRRQRHERRQLSRLDLLAGCLQQGQLLRTGLAELSLDADNVARAIDELAIDEISDNDSIEHGAVSNSLVTQATDFGAETREIVRQCDALAAERGLSEQITERDLVNRLLASVWKDVVDAKAVACDADQVRAAIHAAQQRHGLDDNGCLMLDGLESGAREVIELAHSLSQWRGICPIPTRLMFVAFLQREGSAASRLVESQQVYLDLLCATLIHFSGHDHEDSPETFPLGWEASSRIVAPMVRHAKLHSDKPLVSEFQLFESFCAVAPPEFKSLLRALPGLFRVDLDGLFGDAPEPAAEAANLEGQGEPAYNAEETATAEPEENTRFSASQFDEAAWRLFQLAVAWAHLQGSPSVRTPHLFAALVDDGMTVIGMLLRRRDLDPETTKVAMLSLVPPSELCQPSGEIRISRSVWELLKAAEQRSFQRHATRISCQDITHAFRKAKGGIVGQTLATRGMPLDDWA